MIKFRYLYIRAFPQQMNWFIWTITHISASSSFCTHTHTHTQSFSLFISLNHTCTHFVFHQWQTVTFDSSLMRWVYDTPTLLSPPLPLPLFCFSSLVTVLSLLNVKMDNIYLLFCFTVYQALSVGWFQKWNIHEANHVYFIGTVNIVHLTAESTRIITVVAAYFLWVSDRFLCFLAL